MELIRSRSIVASARPAVPLVLEEQHSAHEQVEEAGDLPAREGHRRVRQVPQHGQPGGQVVGGQRQDLLVERLPVMHQLRLARRAAGLEAGGKLDVLQFRLELGCRRDQQVPSETALAEAVHRYAEADRQALAEHGLGGRVVDEDVRVRQPGERLDLPAARDRRDPHRPGPDQVQGELERGQFKGVADQHEHAGARADAPVLQGGGQVEHLRPQPGEADPAVASTTIASASP